MQEEEARLFQELIQEYCGVSYGLDSCFFFERRLGPRLEELGLDNFRDYYHYLRYDPDGAGELERLIERITTHETYFFRESYQLDAFRFEILPEFRDSRKEKKKLSAWSAGCSTGEEVYTIAMLIREAGLFDDWDVRVVGSDISRKVLAQARAASYGENSFRVTDPKLREKYFESGGGRDTVKDEVRALCSFGHLNLLETDRFRVFGPVDVIFCRNVLMYLSKEARHRVVESFYDCLTPGGYLLLGHSESLLNVSTRFELAHLENDLVYRRPLEENED